MGAASVTVIAALMQSPGRCGVSADSPLGRSTATIGMSDALTSAITVSSIPLDRRLQTRAEDRVNDQRALGDLREVQLPGLLVGDLDDGNAEPARGCRGSSARRRGRRPSEPITNTEVSTPRCSSVRAMTKPSPPLLPRPHSTATRPASCDSYAASMAATTWRPAFSISTSDGMPMSSIGEPVGLAHLRGGEDAHVLRECTTIDRGPQGSAVRFQQASDRWRQLSMSTAGSPTSARRSSRYSTTASSMARACTRRSAPTTAACFSTIATRGGCAARRR